MLVLIVCLSALSAPARAQDATAPQPFTDQELDNLLAPIALYPDPLLAQILPASTYPEEMISAYAWQQSGGDASGIDAQSWDESVKAVAHYPEVLKMMAGNMDWTANLGEAFLNQPEDVTRAIQRLREEARAAGNLESNSMQEVDIGGGDIKIIPVQPEYLYIPLYDPTVVFFRRWTPGWPPFVTFGPRLLIGGWLIMDFDWGRHRLIYHGWNRPGWVSRARPYVHVPNVYVNRSSPLIRQTWRHDAAHGSPERYMASRPGGSRTGVRAFTPEIRGGTAAQARTPGAIFGPRGNTSAFSNRGKASLGAIKQPQAPSAAVRQPAPAAVQRPSAPPSRVGSTERRPERESVQPPRTPSVTFGGYRGANETRTQSLRGQSSRQSIPAVRPSPAPASRGSAPAPAVRSAPEGGKRR